MNKASHRAWLLQLTATPTATGREQRVIGWVTRWAAARQNVVLGADRFGNLLLRRRGARSSRPIFFTAHMDHPAFVVVAAAGPRRLCAEFRGGVADGYFVGSRVRLHREGGAPACGTIRTLTPARDGGLKRVEVEFRAAVKAAAGDVMTWDTGRQRTRGDRLYAPACDDLAGVAAALAAFDETLRRQPGRADVRVLLTRAEEVGFVGAIAACKAGTLPRGARIIALENSRSFPESPIGGGPIVRVGDYTSTFDPDLTYRVARLAGELAAADKRFKWQRKLMPGGTCEASAYQAYGYTAACLCLPLGNYHNMDEAAGKIAAETISLSDYHGLVRLLVAVAAKLDDPAKSPPLKRRLDTLFATHRRLLKTCSPAPQTRP